MIIYNVPAAMLGSFPGQRVVIRSSSAKELAESAQRIQPERLAWVQLLSVDEGPSPLLGLGRPMPVELVLGNVVKEAPLLYRFSELLSEQPVRVAISCEKGAKRAANVAASLGFSVRLNVLQPEGEVLTELMGIADLYLHNPTLSQPIEFFHSLLAAMCRQADVTLWQIQEEDPAVYRYVTDDGREVLAGRLSSIDLPVDNPELARILKSQLVDGSGECASCDFLKNCAGYFKFPDRTYQCDGVKRLMRVLMNAASELMADLKASGQLPDSQSG